MTRSMLQRLGWPVARRQTVDGKRARRYRPLLEPLEDRTAPANLAAGFSETAVATGLSSATAMDIAPDGKLFVAEQGGTLEVWLNGAKVRGNFFLNTPLSVATESERGLLGVAFDPNYASNRFIYVYYTTTAGDRHNRVSRFTANAAGDLAVAASEVIVWEGEAHAASNHNGGAIHFGADGKLYIATGDNANGNNSQSLSSLHGKVLRINANGSIPSDNPFFNQTTAQYRAIWARGLRNPFTFSFRQGTNEMFINDVGQGTWEEINEGAAGANYGWPSTEGNFNQGSFPSFTRPFYAYDHEGDDPNGCAITGGAFYNPTAGEFPAGHFGDYFFADFCGGWINRIDSDTKQVIGFASGIEFPVDLKVDDAGNLYYLARGSGAVFQVSYTVDQPPAVTQQPADQTTSEGLSATFKVYISGTFPLTYQWQRNDNGGWSDISGANSSSYTLTNAQLSDSGALFRAHVSNGFGDVTSDAADLTVIPVGTGTGLSGTYYDGLGFTGRAVMRNDATVNFNFGNGAPVAGIAPDTFSVHWLGKIQPRFSQTYTFFTTSDDGVRLWVNNQLIINNWTNHSSTVNSGNIALVAGQKYDVRMDYYDNTGTALAKLGWQSASQVRQVVPQSQLYLNEAPTVATEASANPAPVSGTTTNLSALGADDAGEGGLVYTWAATSKPANVPNPTFSNNGNNAAKNAVATFHGDGEYTLTVTIRDLGGKTVTSSVNVSVADTLSTIQPGLKADFFNFNRSLSAIPSIAGRTPTISRIDSQVNYSATHGVWPGLDGRFADTFVSRHTGLIDVPVTGKYTFYLASNDGSKLFIDGQLVINHDGLHGIVQKAGTRTLAAGLHAVHVKFFENDGAAGLRFYWAGPGFAKQVVPAGALFHQPAPWRCAAVLSRQQLADPWRPAQALRQSCRPPAAVPPRPLATTSSYIGASMPVQRRFADFSWTSATICKTRSCSVSQLEFHRIAGDADKESNFALLDCKNAGLDGIISQNRAIRVKGSARVRISSTFDPVVRGNGRPRCRP